MSAKNVEVVRDALDAFGAADTERLLQFMDPEIEFEPHLALLEGNYRGHDGVREFMADAFPTPEVCVRIDHPDFRDLGDRVLASGTFYIRGGESGVDYEAPFAVLASFREGADLPPEGLCEQDRGPRSRRAVRVALWTKSGGFAKPRDTAWATSEL
jgi:ketosteroid isomerase-like protein